MNELIRRQPSVFLAWASWPSAEDRPGKFSPASLNLESSSSAGAGAAWGRVEEGLGGQCGLRPDTAVAEYDVRVACTVRTALRRTERARSGLNTARQGQRARDIWASCTVEQRERARSGDGTTGHEEEARRIGDECTGVRRGRARFGLVASRREKGVRNSGG